MKESAFILYLHFLLSSEAPGAPIVTLNVQATSITVKWQEPADNGGSFITGYRVLILHGTTQIKDMNITDLSTREKDIGGLNISTSYTVRVFARNYVFEGNATEKEFQTKFKGKKLHSNSSF